MLRRENIKSDVSKSEKIKVLICILCVSIFVVGCKGKCQLFVDGKWKGESQSVYLGPFNAIYSNVVVSQIDYCMKAAPIWAKVFPSSRVQSKYFVHDDNNPKVGYYLINSAVFKGNSVVTNGIR